MSVRLTVIGSSPAWPNPGGAHSGYLVESDEGGILLDCGPGVLARLRHHGLHRVDAIAITHFHLDHWGDLVPWAWLARHGNRGARPALWLPPRGVEELDAFEERWGCTEMFSRPFEIAEYAPDSTFAAAGFEVEPIAVEHYDLSAYGFRIRDGSGRVLAYSGDTGPCEALRKLATEADLLLCEATLATGVDEPGLRGHLSADEALLHASGPVLLTHRPIELPSVDGVPIAADGLAVEI